MIIPNEGDFEGDTVTIPVDEYIELTDSDEFLACLHQAGVDNWEGYQHAVALMNG